MSTKPKPSDSRTLGLAKWLQSEAEVYWGIADNEGDKLRARRMHECAAELLRFHRLKIRAAQGEKEKS